MSLTNAAILEISELCNRAEVLARGTPQDRQQSSVLLSRIRNIREQGLSSDEMRARYATATLDEAEAAAAPRATTSTANYRTAFRRYMAGYEFERRDLEAGSQTLSWTQGASGGYTVDTKFNAMVFEGLKQVCPLFDPSVVTLIEEPTFAMNPKILSGWDLTSVTSSAVGEAAFMAPVATPSVSGQMLTGFTHRVTLAQTVESNEDILDSGAKTARAASIGFARGIGAAITTTGQGHASSQGQSVVNGAIGTGVVLGSGTFAAGGLGVTVQDELNNLFFSLNRIHRASPKCCFLTSDAGYQKIREARDSQDRPLLSVHDDTETLFGKRVLISPDMAGPGGSPAVLGEILFGDFSHFVVRLSAISAQRTMQTSTVPGTISVGEMLWNFRVRYDSTVFDASNGAAPPIVSAVIHP